MIHSQSMANKTVSINNAEGYTVNEMLEEVEKAATRTATSLLSTIVQLQIPVSVSPELHSGTSSLSNGALSKIDTFKEQLEDQNNALKKKIESLEEKLKNLETSNINASVNEIVQLRNLIVRTQRHFEEDKIRLLKEFENERNLTANNSMLIMKKFKDELELKINEKDNDMRKYLQKLQSMLPLSQVQKKIYVTNDHRIQQPCVRESTVESSFVTEEEEAIARISEKMHMLKSKIDSRDNSQAHSKNRNDNSEDFDDVDTKELIQLNEQIRQLKSHVIKKNNVKKSSEYPQSIMKHDKVYLPIQHMIRQYSSEDNLHLVENDHHLVKNAVFLNRNPQFKVNNSDCSENENSDKNGDNSYQDMSCSPERRYTSSIEIPAKQLENMKASAKPNSAFRRSKSMSSSYTNMLESNLKNHSVKLQTGSNLISVCLKSLKRPDGDGRKSEDQIELASNLNDAQKEVQKLKGIIEEKNTLITSQRVNSFDKNKHDKEMIYLLQLLETQSKKIIGLKNKIKDLRDNGNWNSDTMSSLSDSLDRVRNDLRDNLETVNCSDIEETFKKIKSNEENRRTRKAAKYINKDDYNRNNVKKKIKIVSESGIQTDDNLYSRFISNEQQVPSSTTLTEQNFDETKNKMQIPVNTLVCNIPEHHELEDLAHQNRDQIINLKNLLQQNQDELLRHQMNIQYDVNMIEKHAEFDALDLAINNRKQVLYDLEVRKRRELNSTLLFDDRYVPISEKGVKYLRVSCFF